MKKLINLTVLILIMLVFSGGYVFAYDWYFEIENPDEDNVFDIWFKPVSEAELNSYTLCFDYNTDTLTWSPTGTGVEGTDYTHTPPSPLFALGVPTDYPHKDPVPDSGTITNFSALVFGPDGAIVDSNYHLGTLIFTGNGTESAELTWATWLTDLGLIVNDELYMASKGDLYTPEPGLLAPVSEGILAGDIDNDDDVDLTDVMLALQIAAGITTDPPNMDADVNGDAKIGAEESIYVVQTVAGLR